MRLLLWSCFSSSRTVGEVKRSLSSLCVHESKSQTNGQTAAPSRVVCTFDVCDLNESSSQCEQRKLQSHQNNDLDRTLSSLDNPLHLLSFLNKLLVGPAKQLFSEANLTGVLSPLQSHCKYSMVRAAVLDVTMTFTTHE